MSKDRITIRNGKIYEAMDGKLHERPLRYIAKVCGITVVDGRITDPKNRAAGKPRARAHGAEPRGGIGSYIEAAMSECRAIVRRNPDAFKGGFSRHEGAGHGRR